MAKSPEIEAALEAFTKQAFGRSRKDDVCVTCGSLKVKPEDFKNEIAHKEFGISRMCQVCQDGVFGG